MEITDRIIRVLTGILLVFSTAVQLMAMLFGVIPNSAELLGGKPWMLPAWIAALILLILTYVLQATSLRLRRRWPLVILILSLLGAVLALLTALELKNAFPAQVGASGGTQGLTLWRLCWRHLSSVLVGVLTALSAVYALVSNRSRRKQQEEAETVDHYDLTGKPLFRDDSTLGLTHFGGDEASHEDAPRKLKRSQRRALEKAEKARMKQLVDQERNQS